MLRFSYIDIIFEPLIRSPNNVPAAKPPLPQATTIASSGITTVAGMLSFDTASPTAIGKFPEPQVTTPSGCLLTPSMAPYI